MVKVSPSKYNLCSVTKEKNKRVVEMEKNMTDWEKLMNLAPFLVHIKEVSRDFPYSIAFQEDS